MDPVTSRLIHLTRWVRYQINPKNLLTGEPSETTGQTKDTRKSESRR
jgi:hypothetical protein